MPHPKQHSFPTHATYAGHPATPTIRSSNSNPTSQPPFSCSSPNHAPHPLLPALTGSMLTTKWSGPVRSRRTARSAAGGVQSAAPRGPTRGSSARAASQKGCVAG